jgi:hypothetical protein
MKKIVIVGILAWALTVLGGIWGVVQFILYLVKNTPFVWYFAIPLALGIALVIFTAYLNFKKVQSVINSDPDFKRMSKDFLK